MARVTTPSGEQVWRIQTWRGLNENPDGDTKLRAGEASVCNNWRVTRDGNLHVRPGTRNIVGLLGDYALVEGADDIYELQAAGFVRMLWSGMTVTPTGIIDVTGSRVSLEAANMPAAAETYKGYYFFRSATQTARRLVGYSWDAEAGVWALIWRDIKVAGGGTNTAVRGMWSGNVAGEDVFVAACNGKLWKLRETNHEWDRQEIGAIQTTDRVFMFGFAGKLYLLNGTEYKCWDGETLYDVTGYRPLVFIGVQPSGGGTELEQVNKLNDTRRCWISPTGTDATFQLPETGIDSIDYIKYRAGDVPIAEYTADTEAGTITFTTAPAEGTNTIEIGWSSGTDFRSEITAMRYAELFSGTTDNRVFLYGDGTNIALYSGIDYDGNPTAEYFPDMNVLDIGDKNTPITSLIRHYSRLVAFKTHSAYSVQYSAITLPDGRQTAAFYSTPINRTIGHAAMGQAQLVLNDPISLHGKDIYDWKNNASYSSNLTVDERQAKRISDRVAATLSSFTLEECVCYDNNYAQELYVVSGRRALVWNYAADAWYLYTNFPALCLLAIGHELYIGMEDGYIRRVSNDYRNDNGEAIHAVWRSGSLSFNREWLKKYTLRIFLGIKPERKSFVEMYVNSDRETTIGQSEIQSASSNSATFVDADFAEWSFNTAAIPRVTRRKLKAKKYAYCQLVLESNSAETTAKLTSTDITVRSTVYAR